MKIFMFWFPLFCLAVTMLFGCAAYSAYFAGGLWLLVAVSAAVVALIAYLFAVLVFLSPGWDRT